MSDFIVEGRVSESHENTSIGETRTRDQHLAMPLAVSVSEFCRLTSLGRTKAYQLIAAKKVSVCRIDRRTLILTRSIVALLEGADPETDR